MRSTKALPVHFADIIRRALREQLAQRLASRPVVFLDFDETLTHATQGDMARQITSAERKVAMRQKFHDKLQNDKTLRALEAAKEELAQLRISDLPVISFPDGTVMTLHPRPGLHRFLAALRSFATLYVFSHGSPDYLAQAVPALGIEGYFKGVVSAKGGGGLPRNLPAKWILVDDLAPNTSGTKTKLNMLGDTNPERVVQIKPYLGGTSDNALAQVVPDVKYRLQ